MTVSIAEFLCCGDRIAAADAKAFNGFSGLHGGLAVAMLVRRMRALAPADREMVSVTARFIRPLVWPIVVTGEIVKTGNAVTIACATASSASSTCVDATSIFGSGAPRDIPVFTPEMPVDVIARAQAAVFAIPPEFVPISERMEIRAAVDVLPYSGSAEPTLCGWVRLTDPVPSGLERITILIDSLAPSYTAVLTELRAVPTVEMSVQLTTGAVDATFDWVLVRAQTTSADADGFIRETIDMWTAEGQHLASCHQLRIVR